MNIFENAHLINYDETLVEGAKMDNELKNFMKQGEDYKGLKSELNNIIEANNLPKDKLRSKGKGLMHVCKRIIQICCDLTPYVSSTASSVHIMMHLGSMAHTIAGVVSYVVIFYISRLLRYMVDTKEFKTIVKDGEDCIYMLREKARDTDNEELAKKFNSEADKIEEAIKKYSE